jgi:hypothetical protein
LEKTKAPILVEQRRDYVTDLAGILKRFVLSDVLRENDSRLDDRTLWLSDRTAARVIRLLGDLNAVEAVETIPEYLLLPWDMDLGRLQGPLGQPTTWALFQIGDPSLPVLRTKMTSGGERVSLRAAHTAGYILGPRAEEQMDMWISEAGTVEQRERLATFRSYFVGVTRRAQRENLFTLEDYRRARLEQEQRVIEKHRDRPGLTELLLKGQK